MQKQYIQDSYNAKHHHSDLFKLCLGWLIILSTYLLVYSIFIMFGLIAKQVLGVFLIAVPYIVGTLYYIAFCKGKSKTFYALGVLVPCIAEKILIYSLSAFLYDINPMNISNVIKAITDGGPYVKLAVSGGAGNYPNASFFSWGYVFGGLVLSFIMVALLNNSQKDREAKQR